MSDLGPNSTCFIICEIQFLNLVFLWLSILATTYAELLFAGHIHDYQIEILIWNIKGYYIISPRWKLFDAFALSYLSFQIRSCLHIISANIEMRSNLK